MRWLLALVAGALLGCSESRSSSSALDAGGDDVAAEAGALPAEAPDASASLPAPSDWRPLFDDLEAPVLSVWGTSLERAFFVGEGGLILQREQESWWRWVVPTEQALWWVWGRSDQDVYAGGEGGTLLHFDGREWRTEDSGLDGAETVWGIWGEGDVVWAVGGRASTNGPGFLLRQSAGGWSRVDVGEVPNLYKVWGDGEGESFVVGDDSSLYRLSGDELEEQELGPYGDTIEPLFTVSGNAHGEVFAVGGVSQGLAFELGANGFELVPFATAGLNGVSVADSGDITVVGLFGVIRERAEGTWTTQDLVTDRHYHAAYAFADGAYAVGGDLLSSGSARGGLIAVRGDGETPMPPIVTWREALALVDAGVLDTGADAAVDAAAPNPADASTRAEAGAPTVLDAATDDAGGVVPVPPSDGGPDAGRDVPAVDASPGLPGPAELCTDDFECAPGLECWYVQGQSELRCVRMCESPLECDPEFGPDPQCAPPGCQTVLGACLRAEWVGCFL